VPARLALGYLAVCSGCGAGVVEFASSDSSPPSDSPPDSGTDAGSDAGQGVENVDAAPDPDRDSGPPTGDSGVAPDSGSDVDANPDPCPISDADGDGHDATTCAGDDCDDADADVHPGAPDGEGVGDWIVESVQEGWDPPWPERNPIAADADGLLHVAYVHAGAALHATNPAGVWIAEEVDRASGGPDLAVGPDGTAHLAYELDGELRWATNAGGSWESLVIAADGTGPAIALDPDSRAHLAWYDDVVGDVRHASELDGWTVEIVDAAVRGDIGTVLDLQAGPDSLHLAYSDFPSGEVRYARREAGEWTVETVAEGAQPSLALQDGATALAFCSRSDDDRTWEVRVASLDGGWDTRTADDVPWCAGPALAASGGGFHAAFLADERMIVATDASGEWAPVAGPAAQSTQPGIAIAPGLGGDAVHLTYSNWDFRDLDYVHILQHASRNLSDGIDTNCDGVDGIDADGDGRASVATGGDDEDD